MKEEKSKMAVKKGDGKTKGRRKKNRNKVYENVDSRKRMDLE